jgi:hypothetical protein
MNEPRPVEPYSASENPEQWAEIADWERRRANRFAVKARKFRKVLVQLEEYTRDIGWVVSPKLVEGWHETIQRVLEGVPDERD